MGIHDLPLRSTQQGTRAGVAAALGIAAGAGVHIAAAAVGVSAIITASAWAFTTLKWLGALYLGYIGVRMLWDSFASHAPSPPRRMLKGTNFRGIFLQGFLTNALNPKVALFFLAFLPQFIDAGAPSKAAAFVLLGLLFDTTGTIWNLAIAWSFGKFGASAWLYRLRPSLDRAVGGLFVALGIKLAFAEAR
jgi:threonine/homoserine/homoserine lactone efflux protein